MSNGMGKPELLDLEPTLDNLDDVKGGAFHALGRFSVGLSAVELGSSAGTISSVMDAEGRYSVGFEA